MGLQSRVKFCFQSCVFPDDYSPWLREGENLYLNFLVDKYIFTDSNINIIIQSLMKQKLDTDGKNKADFGFYHRRLGIYQNLLSGQFS